MSGPMLREKCVRNAVKERERATERENSADSHAKSKQIKQRFACIALLGVIAATACPAIFARTSRIYPPSNLAAAATSSTQVSLKWSAPQRGVTVASYSVWRCEGTSCRSFVQVASVSGSSTSYQDSGLSASTVYDYRVRSVSAQGTSSSSSNTATATTLAIAASPVITSATTGSAFVGTAFTYQIKATNSPSSYSASGLPGGLAISTASGLISGTPTSAGNFSVSLSATNGSGTGIAKLALTVSSPAQISANPSSVTFGTVAEGTTNSQPITLTNSGANTLTFSQISVTGAGFGQTGLSTSTTIAPGGRMTFNATFAPTSASTVSGSITLTTSGTPSPLTISLSGTGQATSLLLSASPTSLAFGNVMDQSSKQLTTTVKNAGNSNVTISGVSVTGAGLSASGVINGTVLMPGQSVLLTVSFAPISGGAVSGSVSVTSNATNSPANVALSGTGMHSVVLTWDASPTSGVTYNVFRGTASGVEGTTPINTSPLSALTFTDASVTPGTGYYYTVEAVDSGGSSGPSNEAAAKIPSP
ncbi:MAG TPA: choice-of-anchor D domain-containing protein [Candidatus Acidoferrales bacterium]|nr:choice-of-anchor D domain-containing protein [Candidatus Acidoferrales bacterium]